MKDRDDTIDTFLEKVGLGDAVRQPMGGDWSKRRYERVLGRTGTSAILMDASQDVPVEPFVRIGGWLRGIGLHAPAVLAADLPGRLLLLEDLGDDLLAQAIRGGAPEDQLYELAVDVILHYESVPAPTFLPRLDDAGLIGLLDLFVEQDAKASSEPARLRFREIWRHLLAAARVGDDVFLHRDYHAQNLLWLGHEEGLWRLGLLDFQDAFRGPPVYDLVSLLQDARRDVAADVRLGAVERYRRARPGLTAQDLDQAMAILGAQRALRILGVLRRIQNEQKQRRLPAGIRSRVVCHLNSDLAHPALDALKAWCEGNAPHLLLDG